MKKIIKSFIKKLPFFGKIIIQRDLLLLERNNLLKEKNFIQKLNQTFEKSDLPKIIFYPGHFYSPIPSIEDIRIPLPTIHYKKILSIDFNINTQLFIINKFRKYYKKLPFKIKKSKNFNYFFENPNYSYGDAIILYSFIMFLKPKTIIEIGSGYSTALMIDINKIFFKNKIKIISIEPYPNLLKTVISKEDHKKFILLPEKIQNVNKKIFKLLKQNDILFIDSTHISKYQSDVNKIFFEILPDINKNVYIHFHDIFYPFEYPKIWLEQGYHWNEIYLLRAFLQYNNNFKIVFFNNLLWNFFKKDLLKSFPLFSKNPGGAIWIKKIR